MEFETGDRVRFADGTECTVVTTGTTCFEEGTRERAVWVETTAPGMHRIARATELERI